MVLRLRLFRTDQGINFIYAFFYKVRELINHLQTSHDSGNSDRPVLIYNALDY